jgi:serine/threonine-protein kinase HipA
LTQPRATKLTVNLDIEGTSLEIGKLAWSRDDKLAAFEYSPSALESRLAISPFRARLAQGVIMAPRSPFEGLHGVFADSLPDGWGRLLVDRQILRTGGNPATMTPIDRLAIVGSHGMGALTYAPEQAISGPTDPNPIDLDWFANQAEMILQGHSSEGITKLLDANGGSAGARPKIMALRDPVSKTFHVDHENTGNSQLEHWLIKLKHRQEEIEFGRVEHAYAEMARAAGINFPQTALITDTRGTAHFAVERFDRTKEGQLHTHTLAGLINADFRTPSLDYEQLLLITKILSKDQKQVEEAFRRMVFNVLSGNRDDHAKNHAFLMNKNGQWKLSPAYDVTPSSGPGGEHNMTIAGEGRAPGLQHFAIIAEKAEIPKTTANLIIDQVTEAVASWRSHADGSGIGDAETSAIAKLIDSHAKPALGKKGSIVKDGAQKKSPPPRRKPPAPKARNKKEYAPC